MKHTEHFTTYDGISTNLHYDENDGKLIVQNSCDVQGLIDKNKERRNDNSVRGKNMRQVASVPLHMLYEMQAMWDSMGIDRKEGMKKFLNDPDMRAFRTSEDRI